MTSSDAAWWTIAAAAGGSQPKAAKPTATKLIPKAKIRMLLRMRATTRRA